MYERQRSETRYPKLVVAQYKFNRSDVLLLQKVTIPADAFHTLGYKRYDVAWEPGICIVESVAGPDGKAVTPCSFVGEHATDTSGTTPCDVGLRYRVPLQTFTGPLVTSTTSALNL